MGASVVQVHMSIFSKFSACPMSLFTLSGVLCFYWTQYFFHEVNQKILHPFMYYYAFLYIYSDVLGTAFKPVKSDIDGNVTVSCNVIWLFLVLAIYNGIIFSFLMGNFICQRLTKRYETDTTKFSTLRCILDDEIERKCCEGKDSATQGLLWLKR